MKCVLFRALTTGLTAWAIVAGSISQAQEASIAVVVNDEAITEADITQRLQLWRLTGRIPESTKLEAALRDPDLRKEIMTALVQEAVQRQYAKKNHQELSAKELTERILMIEADNEKPSGFFKSLLHSHKIPYAAFEKQIAAQAGWTSVVRELFAPSIVVSQNEILQYLKKSEQALGNFALYELLTPFDPKIQGQEESSRLQAHQLRQQVLSGKASFTSLAQKYSKAPSAPHGGFIGTPLASSFPKNISDAVTSLHDGEVSLPIKTNHGYYLYMKQQSDGKSFDFIQITIPAHTHEEMQMAAELLISKGRLSKSCDTLSAQLQRRNPQVNIRKLREVKSNQMSQALASVISKLQENTLSHPIGTEDGILGFMVCKTHHSQSTKHTEASAREYLAGEKLETEAKSKLDALLKGANIEWRHK